MSWEHTASAMWWTLWGRGGQGSQSHEAHSLPDLWCRCSPPGEALRSLCRRFCSSRTPRRQLLSPWWFYWGGGERGRKEKRRREEEKAEKWGKDSLETGKIKRKQKRASGFPTSTLGTGYGEPFFPTSIPPTTSSIEKLVFHAVLPLSLIKRFIFPYNLTTKSDVRLSIDKMNLINSSLCQPAVLIKAQLKPGISLIEKNKIKMLSLGC